MTNLQAFKTTNKNWFCFTAIAAIPESWRTTIFDSNSNPFTSEGFLRALEESQCLGEHTGWEPYYYVYQKDSELGLLLTYQKSHSYGEYVFDWAWADAYHRHGINYYPKLVATVPYSPIPCSKWLGNSSLGELEAFSQVTAIHQPKVTGFHYLFSEHKDAASSSCSRWTLREGHQFHWFNQDTHADVFEDTHTQERDVFEDTHIQEGVVTTKKLSSFETFLSLMTARKRKNINKERTRVKAAGISTYWKSGLDVTKEELDNFYCCYHTTYLKRGQTGYLNQNFFSLLCKYLGNQVQILFCKNDQGITAAALYLVSRDTLYGRYWGCIEEAEFVHFEACYYRGIELAIKNKLTTFNPGTQGEHKISRGFKPIKTYSYHQLVLEPFHDAIKAFCEEERQHNDIYIRECSHKLPFK